MSRKPAIVYAALSDFIHPENARSPVTPEQIAADACRCLAAGASIVHNHTEDVTLTGQAAADRYVQGWTPVFREHPDAIMLSTVTVAPTVEERVAHYGPLAAAGMRMGVLDAGVLNLGPQTPEGLPAGDAFTGPGPNSYRDIAHIIEQLRVHRLGPSIAIYEPGWLRVVLAYQRAGRLPPGTLVKLYFSDHNLFDGRPSDVTFGLRPTRTALEAYLELLDGSGLEWAVAVFGGDVIGSGLAQMALERGGHVRVGLEDYRGEREPSNVDLVQAAVELAASVGRPIADCATAARILGLPR